VIFSCASGALWRLGPDVHPARLGFLFPELTECGSDIDDPYFMKLVFPILFWIEWAHFDTSVTAIFINNSLCGLLRKPRLDLVDRTIGNRLIILVERYVVRVDPYLFG